MDPLAALAAACGAEEADLPRLAEVERCRRDPGAWFDRYFAHYRFAEDAEFHDYFNDLVRRMAYERTLENVIGFRNCSKSVRITLAGVIYCASYQARRYIVLLSNDDTAAENLANITDELETNELLRQDFGSSILPRKDAKKQFVKWSDKRIVLNNGVQIRSMTLRQSLRGKRQKQFRPDLLIPDDPQSDRDLESPQQCEKQLSRFTRGYLGALSAINPAVVCLSNASHELSIAGQLKRNPAWSTKVIPIHDPTIETEDITDDDCAWPEVYGADWCRRERNLVGPIAFDQERLCKERDGGRKIFDPARFTRFPAHEIDLETREICGDPIVEVAVALDPSAGFDKSRKVRSNASVDYWALVVVALGVSETIYVVDCLMGKDDPRDAGEVTDDQIEAMVAAAEKWAPTRILVENVAFQRLLRLNIERKFRESGIPIRPQGEPQRIGKGPRFASIQGDMHNGKVRVVDPISQTLLHQCARVTLDGKGGEHDDGPDAMEVAIRSVRRRQKKAHFGPSRRLRA